MKKSKITISDKTYECLDHPRGLCVVRFSNSKYGIAHVASELLIVTKENGFKTLSSAKKMITFLLPDQMDWQLKDVDEIMQSLANCGIGRQDVIDKINEILLEEEKKGEERAKIRDESAPSLADAQIPENNNGKPVVTRVKIKHFYSGKPYTVTAHLYESGLCLASLGKGQYRILHTRSEKPACPWLFSGLKKAKRALEIMMKYSLDFTKAWDELVIDSDDEEIQKKVNDSLAELKSLASSQK